MGYGPPKLKILPKFCNINAPQRRIPQAIFTNFSLFVDDFIEGYALKFGRIRSRGFGVMGLKFRGCVLPQIFSAPSVETMRRMRTHFGGARTVRSPCQVWWGRSSRAAGDKKFNIFYFLIFLSITLALACQIWSRLRREGGYRSSKI